jgi:hypothetical protein
MSCKCEKTSIIKSICDEIEDLDLDNKWNTYLDYIPDEYKKASIRWSLTKTNSRIWFARVLQNMENIVLIEWAKGECFCIDQPTDE